MNKKQPTRLYLVRHGETTWNAQKLLMGREYDAPLTEKGITQADDVASQLTGIPFAAMYSSTLGRSWKTAELLAEALLLRPIQPAPDIEERNYGQYGGHPWAEFRSAMQAWEPIRDQMPEEDRWAAKVHPSVESDAELITRVSTALQKIAIAHPGQQVLIVTHGGILRTLLRFLGSHNPALAAPGSIGNGGIVVLEAFGDDLSIQSIDGMTMKSLSE